MLKLAEGYSGMKFIALSYERLMSRYTTDGKKHPVIMIVDNDKAGKDVFKSVEKKASPLAHPGLYYVTENLYIIEIPKVNNRDTTLEDYFDQTVLNTKINGKSFHRENTGQDNEKSYGKSIFAKKLFRKINLRLILIILKSFSI